MNAKFYYNKVSLFLTCLLIFSLLLPLFSYGQFAFSTKKLNLNGESLTVPTSLQFGPDNRLYVAEQHGLIKVFTIVKNNSNNYVVTATEVINLINQIPNHNDDGSEAPSVITRQVTGIYVTGTASNPQIYVSSSDSRAGGPSGDMNFDTNSGIISLLSWNGSSWEKIDLVRGLPRSEENHSTNGLQLDPQSNRLFIAQGGNTNAGSPSINFAYTQEYALSAAILVVDLNAIMAMPTKGSGNTAYKYDLPTVDDPTRDNDQEGADIGDPFGGNNGLNMAKIVPGGPVQIYAPGFRNPYDLVLTKTPGKARRLYTISNGANEGWGGYPDQEGTPDVTNDYVKGEPGSIGPGLNGKPQVNNLDNLHFIGNIDTYITGSYYGGHPNPTRANPNGAGLYTHDGTNKVWRTSKSANNPLPSDWPPVSSANPVEANFLMPGVEGPAILTFNTSTNGICEYTASNFDNGLKGALLACGFNDNKIYKIRLKDDGTDVTNAKSTDNKLNQDPPLAEQIGTQPLDITAQGDDDIFPGTIWVAGYGDATIVILEPQKIEGCSSQHDEGDADGDGYTNADELDNGTDPCSASSIPADFDKDHISDLNDPDDDNDGTPDSKDCFPIDPFNGLATNLPIKYDLLNSYPGTGFFGLGFTGLMSNRDANRDYHSLYDPNNLIAGGTAGAFSIVATSPGDAYGSMNNQDNAFQFGINGGTKAGPFTVESRMLGPFFNNKTPVDFQSQGIYIGTGDEDNYLKIVLNANEGAGGIEVLYENAGHPVSYQYSLTGGIPTSTLTFYLSVNPLTGTVQPKYSADGGNVTALGAPIQLNGELLRVLQEPRALAVGIISTSTNATPFTATWDYIYVKADESITDNYRINAGGPQVTNSLGTFSADSYYTPVPGFTYSTTANISGTTDGAIYQTERASETDNGSFSYALPIKNGKYTVVLHFAELYWTAPGQRLFDVSIENNRVLHNYDIVRKAGANTATTETFPVTVTDGLLNIDFSALASDGNIDRPKISAIEVLSASTSIDTVPPLPPSSGNYSLKAWPNPSGDGRYVIQLTGDIRGDVTFELFSSTGAKLVKGKRKVISSSSTLEFDFSHQMHSAGMYYLQLTINNKSRSVKLIKQ